jgi:hypothetical protein
MDYVLTGIIVVQILLIGYIITQSRKERAALEDRLMALTNMDAFILHKAEEKPEPGEVTYVDEEREWQLSPGGGGLDGS